MQDGTIECELMQPAFDPGRPIGLVFRAGGPDFKTGYSVRLDCRKHWIELRNGERGVAHAEVPVHFDQWLAVKVEAKGSQITVTTGESAKPLIQYTDPSPLAGRPRRLRRQRGARVVPQTEDRDATARTYVPPLEPARPAGYRGPVSQWWDPVVTGTADAAFGWDADRPFNSLRSQKIEMRSGEGTAGVANRGLHRFGLSVVAGRSVRGPPVPARRRRRDGCAAERRRQPHVRLSALDRHRGRVAEVPVHASPPTPPTTRRGSPSGSTSRARSGWTRWC